MVKILGSGVTYIKVNYVLLLTSSDLVKFTLSNEVTLTTELLKVSMRKCTESLEM